MQPTRYAQNQNPICLQQTTEWPNNASKLPLLLNLFVSLNLVPNHELTPSFERYTTFRPLPHLSRILLLILERTQEA